MTKLYNLEYLEEISGGDQAFISDMISDFVANTPSTLSEVEQLIGQQNWPDLYKIVHKFIPSFEFVGADHIRQDLRTMEHCAKTQTDIDQIPLLLDNIKGFCYDVLEEIKTDFNM
jgi:HPt (histidine-containing phosphotransfer) domain-containing protein